MMRVSPEGGIRQRQSIYVKGWFTSYFERMLQPSSIRPRRLQLYDRSPFSVSLALLFGLQTSHSIDLHLWKNHACRTTRLARSRSPIIATCHEVYTVHCHNHNYIITYVQVTYRTACCSGGMTIC